MSRRAVVKRAKIRRGQILTNPLVASGLNKRQARRVLKVMEDEFQAGLLKMLQSPDRIPWLRPVTGEEERAAAHSFFANAEKWNGPIPDDLKAQLVDEQPISTTP